MNELLRMFVVLTAICLASAFGLTAINNGLAAQIARQKRDNVQVPLAREILAGAPEGFADQYVEIEADGQTYGVFPWIEGDEVKAITIETIGKGGYGGDVRVMTGIDLSTGSVLSVRITESSETPGIGSRVAEPAYLKKAYAGRPLAGTRFTLRPAGGDIEAVSGATRTCTAVADGVAKAIAIVQQHRDEIIRRVQAGPSMEKP